MKKLLILIAIIFSSFPDLQAQTLDEIIENYFESTGGRAQWEALEGIQYKAKINQ